MPLSDKAEEILETLWMEQFERGRRAVKPEALAAELRRHVARGEPQPSLRLADAEVQELLGAGLLEVHDGKRLALTSAGQEMGRQVLRNHRLAERLMADVLDMPEGVGDEAACKVEHALKRGIDERICTLLGHPHFCPHGSPIPPGPCCEEKRDSSIRIVSPLAELKEGDRGTIAYLHTGQKKRLERLLAMGVLPGLPIQVLHRFPSYVFRVGETQIAVDDDLAKHIYVRLGRQTVTRRRWRRRGLFMR